MKDLSFGFRPLEICFGAGLAVAEAAAMELEGAHRVMMTLTATSVRAMQSDVYVVDVCELAAFSLLHYGHCCCAHR